MKNAENSAPNDAVIELDPNEIIFENKIGEGTFGYVFSGWCRAQAVAIKVFKRKEDIEDSELEKFREEIKIMSKIFHPNIVLFMGACTVKGKELMLVTEKLPTDLETLLLKERKPIPLFNKMKMAKDAALGMNWLHCSNPIFIHRDLKLSNLLIDNTQKVCVCDFGLAQMKPRNVSNLEYDPHGSPIYMAPEVFMGEFNEKCDVYSFGICLWEMVTQDQAFLDVGDDLPTFIRAICEEGHRPPINEEWPTRLAKLLTQCWSRKPSLRPSFGQILSDLDKILIDVAIEDPFGRKLWRRKFRGRFEVTWEEFIPVLLKTMHISENTDMRTYVRCLHALLMEDSKAIVGPSSVITMVGFGKVLSFFGPLRSEKLVRQDLSFFHRIKSTLEQKCFHGDTTTDEAESRLKGQAKGSFLVRLSSSVPGCFTISYKAKDSQILHHRARYVPSEGSYYFYEKRYDNLETLIKQEGKKNFYWKEPCPGSKYQHIFALVAPPNFKASLPPGYVAEKDDSKRKKSLLQ